MKTEDKSIDPKSVTGYAEPVIQTSACCSTDPGLARSHNEDTCLVNNDAGYFLVADGMGGAAAGEVASSLFQETAIELFSSNLDRPLEADQNLVMQCFESANDRILSHTAEEPSHAGMGCTAELFTFHNNRFVLGHVGDSRTYHLSNRCLTQLTKDHTLVQIQEEQGLISREQARTHSMRNVILRVVGTSKGVEVDIIHGTAVPGDIFLLCTDGLSGMVDDEQIQEILAFEGPLQLKATMLIDQANHAGGKDNISVALIEVKS
jgi:PPM family protein phosphatase